MCPIKTAHKSPNAAFEAIYLEADGAVIFPSVKPALVTRIMCGWLVIHEQRTKCLVPVDEIGRE
jgi:hypothetical protein